MTDEAKPSRQRRRRSKDVTYDETKEGERKDDLDSGSAEAKPRPSKSGWGMTSSSNEPRSGAKADSIESVGSGRRRANFGSTGSSSSTTHAHAKNRHFDEETSEVMEIPDLEEEDVEEDITAQVAEAPRNITRTVPTMKELNQRIKYSLPSAPANGLDLSILTSALYPLMTVFEEDKVWDFDNLLHDVAQGIQKTVDEKERLKQQLEMNPAATMYT